MPAMSASLLLASMSWLGIPSASAAEDHLGADFSSGFLGRWSVQSAYSDVCKDCTVSIVNNGSALIVMTNMGWTGILETDAANFAAFATGKALTAGDKTGPFNVEMAVSGDTLLISKTAEDINGEVLDTEGNKASHLIAVFERQTADATSAAKL